MHLAITTFGVAKVYYDGHPIEDLGTRKATALLVYLAYNEQPVGREKAAALLWADVPDENARASLSVALSTLRKRLPGYIVADRDTVALNRDLPISLDARRFAEEWQRWQETHGPSDRFKQPALDALKRTLALYQGPFLEDLTIDTGFEEWVRFERERFQEIAVQGHTVLATADLQRGDYPQGLDHARRLLRLDPLREPSHELLMLLLARSGERAAAISHFHACERILNEELGVAPGHALQVLYERLVATPDSDSLPARPVFTAGRAATLEKLERRLRDPGCRILTLTGSRGSGKSHVTVELAWRLRGLYLNGIYFVPVAALKTKVDLVQTIARALSVEHQDVETTREHLSSYLRNREILIVLDGYDALLPTTEVLSELVTHAPYLKVLVTSREGLALQEPWAWQVRLRGLSYPTSESARELTLTQLSARYGAIALFRREARRLGAVIADVPEERAAIASICRLVDGLPLGIQLTAAWLPVMRGSEIAEKLAQRSELWTNPRINGPARQQNLATVLSHSIEGLKRGERRAYLRLSVFPGTFDRAAAEAIAGASLSLLLTLVEKSLVHRTDGIEDGPESTPSFYLPGLLRQHARQELGQDAAQEQAALARHTAYFTSFLLERKDSLRGEDQQRALRRIDRAYPDVSQAWQHAVAQRDQVRAGQAIDSLAEYYRQRGRYDEGEATFRDAAAQFEAVESAPVLVARLHSWQGVFTEALGDPRGGELLLRSSLALLQGERQAPRRDEAFVYLQLSRHAARIDLEESARLCRRAIALYRESGETRGLALALEQMAGIMERSGEPDSAEPLYAASVHYLEECGDLRSAAGVLSAWANAAASGGQLAQAEELARRAHTVYQRVRSRTGQTSVLQQLGLLLIRQGKWDEATILLEASLAACEELGYRRQLPRAHSLLALALANRGDQKEAAQHSEIALHLATEMDDEANRGYALWVAGWISMAKGEFWQARRQLEESLLVYYRLGERVELSHSLAALAIAEIQLSNLAAAERRLIPALEFARETRYPFSALVAVGVAALLLQMHGALERAVQLTAFVGGNVALARSSLINACILKPVEAAAAALSPAALLAAREGGERLELWTTVDVLFEELGARGEVALELGELAFSAIAPSRIVG